MRVKIPKFRLSISFKSHQDCPVACNSKHYSKDKRFLPLIILECLNLFIEFVFTLLRQKQVFVLELPSEVHVCKLLVILSENIKVIKHFDADFVVGSFEVSPQDVV